MNEYQYDRDNDSRGWTILSLLALFILLAPTSLAVIVAVLSWVCGKIC